MYWDWKLRKVIPPSEFEKLLPEKGSGGWWVKTNSVYHCPHFTDEEIEVPRISVMYSENHRSEARVVIQAVQLKFHELPPDTSDFIMETI